MVDLPGPKPDRYLDVDPTNFSTVDELSHNQIIEMADLAYMRGDAQSRATWQSIALERAQADELDRSAEEMRQMMEPKLAVTPGRILAPAAPTPWAGDSQYRDLRVAFDRAKAEADELEQGTHTGDPELVTLRNKQADAWEALSAREADIKEGLSEVGAWTEQDERIQAAQRQLEIKAEQVAAQFQGGT